MSCCGDSRRDAVYILSPCFSRRVFLPDNQNGRALWGGGFKCCRLFPSAAVFSLWRSPVLSSSWLPYSYPSGQGELGQSFCFFVDGFHTNSQEDLSVSCTQRSDNLC